MDDDLYDLISIEIYKSKREKLTASSAPWPKIINELVNKPVEYLWVQELIFTTPSELLRINLDDEKSAHDFELLGLNIDDICEASLRRCFKRLRLFRWLFSLLKEGSISFGGITSRLHSSILDDPKPYRVDMKNYNQILFEWAEFIDDTFEVSQPNYSQVLSLKSE